MYQRQNNLRKVLRWWQSGNHNSAFNTLLQLRDQSVCKDFLDVTFGDPKPNNSIKLLNFESARGVLQLAKQLINSKHQAYQQTGLQAASNIFELFHERIMSLKNCYSVTANGVDVAREERIAKADKLVDILKDIIASPRFVEIKTQQGGQLQQLAERLDTDIDFFTVRIGQMI